MRVCAAAKTARTATPSILCFKHSRASLFVLYSRSHRLAIEDKKKHVHPSRGLGAQCTPFPSLLVRVRVRAREGVTGGGRR